MNHYKISFETGPTAADCREITVEADTIYEARKSFHAWIRNYHPYWINRVMITFVELV